VQARRRRPAKQFLQLAQCDAEPFPAQFSASDDLAQSPSTNLVVTLRRFQTLIVPIARFLETADPKSLDVPCVADIRRHPFVVKSDGGR